MCALKLHISQVNADLGEQGADCVGVIHVSTSVFPAVYVSKQLHVLDPAVIFMAKDALTLTQPLVGTSQQITNCTEGPGPGS